MQLVIIEEKNLATVVQLYKNIFHLDEQASVEMKNRIEKHRQHDQLFGVIEAYRSKGVGSALHDAFLEKMNTDKCILSVKATNQTAIAFYEHKGWKFIKQSVTIIPRVPKQHIVGKKLT